MKNSVMSLLLQPPCLCSICRTSVVRLSQCKLQLRVLSSLSTHAIGNLGAWWLVVGGSGGGDVPGRCDALSFVVAVGDRWSRIRDASGSFIIESGEVVERYGSLNLEPFR